MKIGDIVRFKPHKEIFGLHEVTGTHTPEGYDDIDCTVTKDECNSEYYARREDLILVCSVEERKDL